MKSTLVFAGLALILASGCTKDPAPTGQDPVELVACTEEAKICGDGSEVGRMPPDCEFAECPEAQHSQTE